MEHKEKTSPKDVFLHLLGIIALYISAGSLISLLFEYINIFFPDLLNYYSYSAIAGSIRWSMAALIIVFPVYVLVSWMLNKDYSLNPEKRDLRIRKWLVYFTLFIAAITIIIDLVTLVYNFLGGDLTARFVLKVLVVLLVAGIIFGYYLWDLRKKYTAKQLKVLASAVSLMVLVSVVGGFFTAGSPFKARLIRFDERRINDLQTIQSQIVNYWQQKNQLPSALSDLKDSISGFNPPADPENNGAYEYRILNGSVIKPSFELCANFNLDTKEFFRSSATKPAPYYLGKYEENWDYQRGRTCFTRTIDPDLYSPRTVILEKPIR